MMNLFIINPADSTEYINFWDWEGRLTKIELSPDIKVTVPDGCTWKTRDGFLIVTTPHFENNPELITIELT